MNRYTDTSGRTAPNRYHSKGATPGASGAGDFVGARVSASGLIPHCLQLAGRPEAGLSSFIADYGTNPNRHTFPLTACIA